MSISELDVDWPVDTRYQSEQQPVHISADQGPPTAHLTTRINPGDQVNTDIDVNSCFLTAKIRLIVAGIRARPVKDMDHSLGSLRASRRVLSFPESEEESLLPTEQNEANMFCLRNLSSSSPY
ncbi:hypothetical protein PIIN_09963 [Serendipita indica DSM 11827]|uniref:Uncharacterized protein n=1 Tax=Serendipita indica (strain DSM 11827) TaxID=1109443 RepID=G4TXC4_SERID|nr:hypothetical protein PIIN_09963 [Serendipita indica DSM 11827]